MRHRTEDRLCLLGQCLPGTFSPDGLEICETCQIGFYQSEYAQSWCVPCPDEKTTWRRGTRKLEQCGGECVPTICASVCLTHVVSFPQIGLICEPAAPCLSDKNIDLPLCALNIISVSSTETSLLNTCRKCMMFC